MQDKLAIRTYEVPANHKAKGPHARHDTERDIMRCRKGSKWAAKAKKEGYKTLMDKWVDKPGWAKTAEDKAGESWETMHELQWWSV